MIDLPRLVERARELRPLPATATRFAELLASPNCEVKDLVEVVELDAPLTGRLLRAANSAMSAARSPVKTVRDGLVRLGGGAVLAMAVGAAVRDGMRQPLPAYGLDEDALWRHSVAAALATELLGKALKVTVPAEAFAAALLHDIGKLVIGRHAPEQIPPAALMFFEKEFHLLQTHHAALGGLVAQHWKLPAGMVKGILFHHEPELGGDPVCDLVCLANVIAHESGVAGAPKAQTDAERRCVDRSGLAPKVLAATAQGLRERFDEVLRRFE